MEKVVYIGFSDAIVPEPNDEEVNILILCDETDDFEKLFVFAFEELGADKVVNINVSGDRKTFIPVDEERKVVS